MDTSVPRQRDASDSALVDMLMLEAPVGLALFGPDMRFRWVNAALTRLGGQAGVGPRSGPVGLVRSGQPGPIRLGGPAAVAGVAGADRDPGGKRAAPGPGRGRAAGRGRLSRGLPRPPPAPLTTPAAGVPAAGVPAAGDVLAPVFLLPMCPSPAAPRTRASPARRRRRGCRLRLRLLVPGARRDRAGLRRRPDHAQHGRPVGRGRGGGRGRDQAQRGALPLAGPGRRPGGLGGGAGRRDEGRLAGVALDHRAVGRGFHRVRLAELHPPRGPGAGRARLA